MLLLWKTSVLMTVHNIALRPHWSLDSSSTTGVSDRCWCVLAIGYSSKRDTVIVAKFPGFASSPSSWMKVGWEDSCNQNSACGSCWGVHVYWDPVLAWPTGLPNLLKWEPFCVTSFRSVDLLAVIIDPLYGTGSNSGLAWFDLFCLTRVLSPMWKPWGLVLHLVSA